MDFLNPSFIKSQKLPPSVRWISLTEKPPKMYPILMEYGISAPETKYISCAFIEWTARNPSGFVLASREITVRSRETYWPIEQTAIIPIGSLETIG
jgi:hypothetical protein